MSKGLETRHEILQHAVTLASSLGLEGLTIGRLATDLELSKSGLFAHFQSKETLQIEVLDFASQRFTEMVISPSLEVEMGLSRIRAVFENWMKWGKATYSKGGCIFVAAAAEMDDRPGVVRDHLVRIQKKWVEFLALLAKQTIEEGTFRKELDPTQFAQEFYGVMLSCHHFARLLNDRQAETKARLSFENLVKSCTVSQLKKGR